MPTLTVYGTGVWSGPTMWAGEPVSCSAISAARSEVIADITTMNSSPP